ncbi:DM13 domain-containing protein [Kitasatospora sp. NPDC094015]|uniref:DM13 domain-containing protein n=1 Tax=Kitasatospora sp. NPDC094015 TaxID=3155205 RepID=UPI0033231875
MPARVPLPRRLLLPLAALLLAVAAGGLYLFEPWRAFTSTTVDEAAPVAAPPAPTARATPAASAPSVSASAVPGVPVTGSDRPGGGFVAGEHPTSGTARLIRLADGSAVLRLEDLRTSEGPDVRVYLSTRPAAESWLDTLGPGALELGPLKGNQGNQNYAVPPGTDLTAFRSAVIWCHRFSVGFGAADLPRG